MKKTWRDFQLLTFLLLTHLAFSSTASATLLARAGGTMYYDTVFDITWTQDDQGLRRHQDRRQIAAYLQAHARRFGRAVGTEPDPESPAGPGLT